MPPSQLSVEQRLDSLTDEFLTELDRMLKEKKIPGSAMPRFLDYFTAHENRKIAQLERERQLQEQAEEDPLALILVDGLPLERKVTILREYAHDLRQDLDLAEKALTDLAEGQYGNRVRTVG